MDIAKIAKIANIANIGNAGYELPSNAPHS